MKPLSIKLLLFLLLTQVCLSQSFETPNETFETYLQACKLGDFDAAEMCYTKSSRELAKQDAAHMEPRSPEMLQGTYERLKDVEFKLEEVNAKRAIFWPEDESIPPMFMRIQVAQEGWRIDYHFMSRYVKVTEDGWSWRNKRLFSLWKKRE
jgi:hypothetical protein